MKKNQVTEYVRAEENQYPSGEWKFTALDQTCFPMIIRGTLVYDVQLDVDTMKTGLKKLLYYYPHLSGRMKDKNGIQFTNDGVLFTVTNEPGLLLKDVLKKVQDIERFSTDIKPSRIRRGIDAPLSVKITKLQDGSVLGIKCSHACMDGDSFYTMLYNWGQICKNENFDKPILDQSLFFIPEELSKDQIQQAAFNRGWKKISKLAFLKILPTFMFGIIKERTDAFYFSADGLNQLKQRISTNVGFPCSTHVALSAFISKMLMKLFKHSEKTTCVQVTVVNLRNRLVEISSTFVGNASSIVATPNFSAGASLEEIAGIIHQTLQPLRETSLEELRKIVSLGIQAMKLKLPVLPFDFTEMYSKKPTVFYMNNFSKFHIYDLDFGSRKPVSIIPHNLSDQVLIWPAHPAKGGVEVYFSGVPARVIRKMNKEDPWFQEMKQYS